MPMGATEVRPRATRNSIVLAVGCGAFTALGVWMLLSGEEVLIGLLGVAFFGGFGFFYALPRVLRRRISMVLTPEGIEQRYPEGSAFLRWSDVEKVGICSVFSQRMVGIRLKSYDRYLDGLPPLLAAAMLKGFGYLRQVARVTSLATIPEAVGVWSKLGGQDPAEMLKSLGQVGDLAAALTWTRKQFGYDIALSWAEIDRPAPAFVALLESYREKG